MLGFSLLGRDQTEAAWDTPFTPLRATQEFLRVGPVGPGFCVYQSRQHLIVVDPATGRVAWRRELEPHSGLLGESETGLFGDREALFVFGADQSMFTVYETATGREIRQGRPGNRTSSTSLTRNRRAALTARPFSTTDFCSSAR
jgi:outer membrane protein assembly factor BamB